MDSTGKREVQGRGPRYEWTPFTMALRLALVYFVIAGGWVVFSDRLLATLGLPIGVERTIASLKGLGFVLVTATALFGLVFYRLKQVRAAQKAVVDQDRRIRQAYVDVLDAVTGGRLVLVTDVEMADDLGVPLMEPQRISSASELGRARARLAEALLMLGDAPSVESVQMAAGEALNNVLKHAGSGTYQALAREGTFQVLVKDQGPGIDFTTLPKATLKAGFSTANTLGMGFTIMLQISDRLLICTEPGSTAVLLELVAPHRG
jgi:anti-sigma regulatory factor (Ser/Thr protein kinase)